MRIIRKILAAVLIVTAIAAASAAVPGLIHNVAHACPGGARDC